MSLQHADDSPSQRFQGAPPAERAAIDEPSARPLVRERQLLDRSQAGDLTRATERPRAYREPREVFERIAQVRQLPVDRRDESVCVDEQVPETEVSVQH